MIFNILLVAAGSATGGVLRYLLATLWMRHPSALPWWTLAVNVVGSFAIGIAITMLSDSLRLRLLVITGFCGGFTTFSAFSAETLELLEQGAVAEALGNIALNVVLSIAACWAGALLSSQWRAS